MGVTYKLKDEVVHFIVSQRQSNSLLSCRQLAESASQKFGLHLSKSSVHDVLKESGIITPRGRKPKNKFEIPREKKKQIQASLSQVKLLTQLAEPDSSVILKTPPVIPHTLPVILSEAKDLNVFKNTSPPNDTENLAEYEGAGRIFLKAAMWDLGIFSEDNIKEEDWAYYLTYSKGVTVVLENRKSIFIDLPLPLERCIREVADGLINNVNPFILHKVSDEELFKECMQAKKGFKIQSISIVDRLDHIIFELSDIVEYNRTFCIKNRVFVENNEKNIMERAKSIFFSQHIDNNSFTENILNLKGSSSINKDENVIIFVINDSYNIKQILQEAAERLNGMYLRDEQNRLVKVKFSPC